MKLLIYLIWIPVNQANLQAIALDGHFSIEQQGRNAVGYFINFNGTSGVWQKQTLLDTDNWQSDTLTEDFDLSYRAQMKGWQFQYLEAGYKIISTIFKYR